jgi:hypothetical protein
MDLFINCTKEKINESYRVHLSKAIKEFNLNKCSLNNCNKKINVLQEKYNGETNYLERQIQLKEYEDIIKNILLFYDS